MDSGVEEGLKVGGAARVIGWGGERTGRLVFRLWVV